VTSSDPADFGFARKIPDGDSLERDVCKDCGWVHYENPKIVVGSVVTFDDRFLLCRRAISPRKGFWTLPAGFMEQQETTAQGAVREAHEEANTDIHIRDLLGIYDIPHISQVQIMYRAYLTEAVFSPGVESLEVALFEWADIPWDDLAFPTVYWALHHYAEIKDKDSFVPFGNATGELLQKSFDVMRRQEKR